MKTRLLPIAFLLLSIPALAQMQPFTLQEVKLTGGAFKNAQDVDLKYILALNPDKLLAPYWIDAGLPLKAQRYGNWESSGLDGHIGGHYLSALAMMYASTGDAELKKRLDYMISELAQCQAKNGNGYVGGIPQGKVFWERIHKGDIDGSGFGLNNTWVPLYNIHKLFAGLRDAYEYAGNQQAKQVLVGLGDWFIDLIKPLSDEQIQQILRTEHGGINETFADLYLITNDKKYLETAQRLSHRSLLNPLLEKQDKLTGLHANTQIPKVIGFEKIASLTGRSDWSDAAMYFWQNVSQTRSVAFGGNSVREHFNPINDFSRMLRSNQGPETCNSFNMLRLSKALFLDKADPSYLDFYERTLYNHILSSQHPQKGGFVYFTPIRPNHYRVYSQPETSMWCCVGSGLENHTKYAELIYSHSTNDLFVNLFIPSTVNWSDKKIQLTQATEFPYKDQSELVLKLTKPQTFALNIRYPKWAEAVEVLVNGKPQAVDSKPSSYMAIRRSWKTGDRVTVRFKTATHLEYLPDGSNWAAFVHGPIVLAAKTSTDNLDGLFADDSRMGHETKGKLYPLDQAYALVGDSTTYTAKLKPVAPLTFQLDSLTLQPFYSIHDARYQMYFQTFTSAAFQQQQARLKQQEAEALALEAQTVDKVNCGEQQPEVDHGFEGEKTQSGYDDERFWRSTRSFMSYQLQNKNRAGKFLEVSTLDSIKADAVRFLINDQPAEIIASEGKTIRLKAIDNEVLKLKIVANNGAATPRFYQIKLLIR
ncbi:MULTISPECIES: glycoside hydrolase family 127 protein [unclassified Spirosoma]|uniref:glycoside hydrolase family 127 protein n=1 Tax=unclassified Spirosoma TaxID=2621999 RepID=UPI000961ED9B|nr:MULTISPECIES: glycoside hydrolase family 127 protein [unclassified Spirosoma]MBN8825735.1 glycoside hydrolase family 127 protein [Spirosoma sp.]OJW76576.1 MAG: glycosyl hydrolase [Spirosoma sp. 48-14]